jgi:hypothetical protein
MQKVFLQERFGASDPEWNRDRRYGYSHFLWPCQPGPFFMKIHKFLHNLCILSDGKAVSFF